MADFKNRDAVEDVLQEDPKGRRRRQKKLLPKSLLRLIIGLVAIVVIVVVIVVAVTAARGNSDAADYLRYMSSVEDIVKQSDTIGSKLEKLLTEYGDTSRKEIQSELDDYVDKSLKLEKQAQELVVPKELLEKNIHQYFVMVMTFRREGLESLEPTLMNALELDETEASAEQISAALQYLTNSDFLYATVFAKEATNIVKQKNYDGVTIPGSRFIENADLASSAEAQQIISQLKSIGSLQAVHGVAISKVVAQPDDVQIKNGQTYNLTSTDEFTILVTVENQGNMVETDVPVVVTLGIDENGEPQVITVTIPKLAPGEEKDAEIKGINPTDYGVQSTLTIEAGPVPGEKVLTNNSRQATVIFKL